MASLVHPGWRLASAQGHPSTGHTSRPGGAASAAAGAESTSITAALLAAGEGARRRGRSPPRGVPGDGAMARSRPANGGKGEFRQSHSYTMLLLSTLPPRSGEFQTPRSCDSPLVKFVGGRSWSPGAKTPSPSRVDSSGSGANPGRARRDAPAGHGVPLQRRRPCSVASYKQVKR